MAFKIGDSCNGCGACLEQCPTDSISIFNGKAVINPVSCLGCGSCATFCPSQIPVEDDDED